MFDIPFVRFITPCIVLYAFYWALIVNPPVEEEEHGDRLSADTVYSLRKKSADLLDAKRYQEALPLYLALSKAFPENHVYLQSLATIHHAAKDYKREAEMWEQFMQHAPLPIEGCPQMGDAYRASGNLPGALKSQQRCYDFEPDNPDTIFFYAHELERQGNIAKAHELYQKGHRVSPRYPDIATGLARTELRLGKPAIAAKLIEDVIARYPNDADALLVAGIVAFRSNDFKAARTYLERGLKVSNGREEIQEELDRIPDPSKPKPKIRARRKSQ